MNFGAGRILHYLALFLTFCLLANCARQDESGKYFLLPWGPEIGRYSLQKVRIETMDSPYEVSGSDAEVYVGNFLSNRGYIGDKARPNLTLSKDTFIPKDVESSMALVTYAHTERIRLLDRELGIEDNISWPRQVGIQIQVESEGELEYNNAIYLGELDTIAFFPMKAENLPLAINGGVIAHEHWHAHFQQLGLKVEFEGLTKRDEEFNKAVIIRGWNEGLADFYAYVYTGASDFLTPSISHQAVRKLNQEVLPLRGKQSLYEAFDFYYKRNGNILGCVSYPMGTQIAIFLYNMVQLETSGEPRENAKKWMRHIVKSLEGKDRVLAASEGIIDPKLIVEWIIDENLNINHQQNELFESFMTEVPFIQIREAYPCRR